MGDAAPTALLEATAELIEVGPDVGERFEVGLRALLRLLDADRADAGLLAPTSAAYRPVRIEAVADVPAEQFSVPAGDALIRQVMTLDDVAVVVDVDTEVASGPVRELLVGNDTQSVVVRRLEHHDDGFGLVCIDWVGRHAPDLDDRIELVDLFVERIWSPLLRRSLMEPPRPERPDPLAALTVAEREVVRLAALGLSYREIADRRGTSVNTVGHQLRSARRRLGARNTSELARLVGVGEPPADRWRDPAMDPDDGGP